MSASRRLAILSIVVVLALSAPGGWGQDQPHPIAVQVKAALKDPAKQFSMFVHLKAKEGSQEKLEAAFAKAVKVTRKEKGNLAYKLNQDTKTPTQYLLYERWQNLASLEAHLKTPHTTALLKELPDYLAAPPEVRVMIPVAE